MSVGTRLVTAKIVRLSLPRDGGTGVWKASEQAVIFNARDVRPFRTDTELKPFQFRSQLAPTRKVAVAPVARVMKWDTDIYL